MFVPQIFWLPKWKLRTKCGGYSCRRSVQEPLLISLPNLISKIPNLENTWWMFVLTTHATLVFPSSAARQALNCKQIAWAHPNFFLFWWKFPAKFSPQKKKTKNHCFFKNRQHLFSCQNLDDRNRRLSQAELPTEKSRLTTILGLLPTPRPWFSLWFFCVVWTRTCYVFLIVFFVVLLVVTFKFCGPNFISCLVA